MKKFFIALVASLLAICFPDEFKGFLGIGWGTERKACVDAMTKKGWNWQKSKYKDSEQFSGMTYGGKKIDKVSLGFDESNCLHRVFITFSDYDDVDRVFYALVEKYDLVYIKGITGLFTRDLGSVFYPHYGADAIEIRDYEYDIKQAELEAERNKVDESDL